MDSYKEKYIKYKIKYEQLKEVIGGAITFCPICNARLTTLKKVFEHVKLDHNMDITIDDLRKLVQQKTIERGRAAKKEGRYNFNCKYCDRSESSVSGLANHMLVNHHDSLNEQDFELIDKHISIFNLAKSKFLREKFVQLEIKFNRITIGPGMTLDNLSESVPINARRSERASTYAKAPKVKRNRPGVDVELEPAMQPNPLLPDLELSDEPFEEGASGVNLDVEPLYGAELNMPAQHFHVPPDFELDTIPVDLLFESTDYLPIARAAPNMNCEYCRLPFNRYNLAKHLLLRHFSIINMEDLEFIKSVIPKEYNNLRTIHIILQIHKKIIARDRALQTINFLGEQPVAQQVAQQVAQPVAQLPNIDFEDYDTFPDVTEPLLSEELDDDLLEYLLTQTPNQ